MSVTNLKRSDSQISSGTDQDKEAGVRALATAPKLEVIEEDDNVGYREYREGLELEITSADNRRIRWKIDLVILPIFLFTQLLQFLDKTALNYANILNYQQDLKLVGTQFNYLSAIVYAGYFFGQYPATILIGRFPAQKVMGISCLLWGLMVLILTQCHSYSSAMALGGATIAFSFVIFFVLPDSPASAFFLNSRERVLAVKRVSNNQTGIKNKHFKKEHIWVAAKDPKVILLFISVFAAAIPNGVVNSFSTIIIKDLGFSTEKTTQLKSVGDATQIIALFIAGAITLNVPNSRLAVSTFANVLCTICGGLVAFLPRENKWGRLVAFWLVNSQSVGFTVSLVSVSSNMGGYSHRAIASALIFTAYCWGNYAGPFVVQPSQAPEYRGAAIGLLVGYGIKMCCHVLLLVYMLRSNIRRNRKYGPPNQDAAKEAGMQDKTEFENKDFRYVL
ncbi:hypothetical protein EMMF5_004340 [Cystobasidiomycetes sp. EMM_F5]